MLQLAEAAARHDAVGPLSEPVLLELRYGGGPQARNLRLTAGPKLASPSLAGYAHLDPAGPRPPMPRPRCPGRPGAPAPAPPMPRPGGTRARPRNW